VRLRLEVWLGKKKGKLRMKYDRLEIAGGAVVNHRLALGLGI